MKVVKKFLLAILVLIALIFLGNVLRMVYYANTDLPLKTPIDFVVPKGMTVMELAYQLKRQGVLDHPEFLVQYVRFTGQLSDIKAGSYHIAPPITPRQLIKKLVSGDVTLQRFTIVEGWTYQQLLAALNQNPSILHTIDDLSPEEVMQNLNANETSPEGLFYPDTYFFSWGTADKTILQLAYHRMQAVLTTAWQTRDMNLPYKTPYQLLIAASLIEKETALQSERPAISSVILNRLKINMPLQIDASVIYGLGSAYKDNLTRANLKSLTPYNTYLNYGLPPTPIGFPSKSSIEAAAHPIESKNYYYVAKGDGSHVFTPTLAAHNAAIKQYLLPIKNNNTKKEFSICTEFNQLILGPYLLPICTLPQTQENHAN